MRTMGVCCCSGARTGRRVFVNFNDRGDEKQEIKLQRPNIHNLLEAVHYICPS